MTSVRDPDLRWAELAPVDAGVVGGLVTATAARLLAEASTETWRHDYAVSHGVHDGLGAAISGETCEPGVPMVPTWLTESIARRIADFRDFDVPAAIDVRALERKGLLELPRNAEYGLAMLDLPAEWWTAGDPIEDPGAWFAADATLLPAMVRGLLSTEHERGVHPDEPERNGTWQPGLVAAASRSGAGRAQLLACCLVELGREPDRYRTSWLTALWNRAAPDDAEVAAQQPALFRLLAAQSPAGVAFAVERLRQLDRAGLLDDAGCAPALAPVFRTAGTTAARLAVKIMVAIHERSPVPDVQTAAVAALAYEDPDVQSRAVQILVQSGRMDLLREAMDEIEPSVRDQMGPVEPHIHHFDEPVGSGFPLWHRFSADEAWKAAGPWFRPVSPGVLGALLAERGERARSARYDEAWEKDSALWWAIHDAVSAAVAGASVDRETTAVPSWLLPALRRRIADHELPQAIDFATVRAIERSGLLQLEVDDTYVSAMIVGLVAPWGPHRPSSGGRPALWFRGTRSSSTARSGGCSIPRARAASA